MAAHLTRDPSGPPPPGRNEVLLREAIDRLRLQLDAAREVVKAANYHVIGVWDHVALREAIVAYDKAMGGK